LPFLAYSLKNYHKEYMMILFYGFFKN